MNHDPLHESLSHRWFGKALDELGEVERLVLRRATQRQLVSRDTNQTYTQKLTFGQRLADKVALFGGSWAFIMSFGAVLLLWVGLNTWVLHKAFDPYPFIFLNLLLSMLAAIQAPVIMMSQNRQSIKDRLDAAHDYEVNLKAELEIMALHEKVDEFRSQQVELLLQRQQEQLDLLTRLLAASVQGS